MKLQKRRGMMLAALFLVIGLMLGMTAAVSAKEKVTKLPTSVRMYPGSASSVITFTLPAYGDVVKNVKVNSKDVIARVTGYDVYRHSETYSGDSEDYKTVSIGAYSKKEGKYKISFDIYSAKGKKKSSKRVNLFVKSDSPFYKVTYAGKPYNYGEDVPKSGKFKVVMSKGYKLKKLEVGTYKQTKDKDDETRVESEMVYKTFKNGAKIKLGTKGYHYAYSWGSLKQEENDDDYYSGYSSYSRYLNKDLEARTEIRITYIDKWTKKEATTYYDFNRLADE